MAEVNASAVIGPHLVRPADTGDDSAIGVLRRYDKAHDGGVGHGDMHKFGPDIFFQDVFFSRQLNNATYDSLPFKTPFPVTLWAIDFGAVAASAVADCTLDVLNGATSVLDAAEAFPAAGAVVRVKPESNKADIDYDAALKVRVVAANGANLDGVTARLLFQRR